ncbi:hypothetical protein [Lacrimispora brassicae]
MERQEEQLWQECKMVFSQTKNIKTDELLSAIINIVKKYENILSDVADKDFLDYITNMDFSDFITGTNGDNYELILNGYMKTDKCSLSEIWRILSQLIWDLSAMVSDRVCPSCRGDNLAYYTDKTDTHLYESCLGCFSTWETSKLIKRPKEIFPAPKSVLTRFRII